MFKYFISKTFLSHVGIFKFPSANEGKKQEELLRFQSGPSILHNRVYSHSRNTRFSMKQPTKAANNHRSTSSFNSRNLKIPNSLKCFEHKTESIARLRLYLSDTKRPTKNVTASAPKSRRYVSFVRGTGRYIHR